MARTTKALDLQDLCSKRALRHGQKAESYSSGLEYLALETIAQDPQLVDNVVVDSMPYEMDFSEWHTGGPNDGGIDGLLYNEDLTYVAVIQTKYKKGQVDASTLEEARSFFNLVTEWADSSSRNKYNESTQRLLDESQLDPKKQQIDLYFITSMTNGVQDHAAFAEAQTLSHTEAGRNVNCNFLTQSEFLDMVSNAGHALSSSTVPEVSLQIPEGDFFVQEEGPFKILVGIIKGQELAALYNRKDVKNRLFNANVRAALTTGRVNPKIQETAKSPEESDLFLYYNNGVTATCSRFTAIRSTITAENLQVVNGAQTVAALAKALGRGTPNPKVRVLIRIIETNENYKNKSRVADQITRYQNTQNPVKASDFFSNDPFQLWISGTIDKLSGKGTFPPVWYEHKRGIKGSSTNNRKKLTMEQLAMLRYACVVDAPFTYKTPKDIWNGENDNANYWLAFGRKGEQVTEWTAEETAATAWMISTWMHLREQHKRVAKDNPETTYLSVLARYVTALAYHLMLKLSNDGEIGTFLAMEANRERTEQVQRLVLKVCRKAVKEELQTNWKSVANPRLNMPQDSDTWSQLKAKIVGDYAFEKQEF
jgi:hypothetical protein